MPGSDIEQRAPAGLMSRKDAVLQTLRSKNEASRAALAVAWRGERINDGHSAEPRAAQADEQSASFHAGEASHLLANKLENAFRDADRPALRSFNAHLHERRNRSPAPNCVAALLRGGADNNLAAFSGQRG